MTKAKLLGTVIIVLLVLITPVYAFNINNYNPVLKQFTQPDTVIQDTYNPQNLNRYSYVLNNPYKYVDPSGNWFLEIFGETNIGFFEPFANFFRFLFPNENIVNPGSTNLPLVDPLVPLGGSEIYFPNENLYNPTHQEIKTSNDLQKQRDQVYNDYYKMNKKEFYKKNLPNGGDQPFKNDKQSEKRGDLKIDKQGRVVDKKGNAWEYDPKSQHFHRYTGKKYGEYDNIDIDGNIRHEGRSINSNKVIFSYINPEVKI